MRAYYTDVKWYLMMRCDVEVRAHPPPPPRRAV
jgi:hypothetical protein